MKFIKSVLMSILAVSVFCSVCCFPVSADTSIGIGSVEDLKKMEGNPKASYYLTKDIVFDETDEAFIPLFSATNQFKGELDGKGFSIQNINISSVKSTAGSSSYSGIFAYNSGTIKNLNVENATVQGGGNKYSYTGVIAAINLGNIENCYVSGTNNNLDVQITAYTGGVCGQMLKGEIKNTVSYANIYSSKGEQYTGGIVGYTEKGTIDKCAYFGSMFLNGVDTTMDGYGGGIAGFSRAGTEFTNCLFGGGVIVEKTSNSYIGGVSGLTYGKVNGFVSYGTLTPSEVISHIYIGGVAGEDSDAEVTNAYYLKSTINEEITGLNGKELSEDEFLNASNFAGLDFSSVWEITDDGVKLKGLPEPSSEDVISELVGIKIEKLPKKLDYVQGDPALDLTGLEVLAVYSDKTTPLQQNEYTVGGYNFVIAGEQIITITYKGFTADFTINVEKSKETIIMPSSPTDGSYQEGTSTGKHPDKKPSGSTSSKDDKPSGNASKPGNNSTLSSGMVIGGNVVEDTLDDSDSNISNSTVSDDSSALNNSNSTSEGTINGSSQVGDKPINNSSKGSDTSAIHNASDISSVNDDSVSGNGSGGSATSDDKNNPANDSSKDTAVSSGTAFEDDDNSFEGDNSVSDNLKPSENNIETAESDARGEAPGDNNTIGTVGNTNSVASQPKVPGPVSPWIIVVVIIIGIVAVAAIVIWFVLKSKSKLPENEISNEELEEVENDENDVYNK